MATVNQNSPSDAPWPRKDAGEALTAALRQAMTDVGFRDRCLVSTVSAKKAVREAAPNKDIPDEVEIQFMTLEELHRLFIIEMPEFAGGNPDDVGGNLEKYIRCSWPQYRVVQAKAAKRAK
jgi:hypothetical protein